MELSFFYIVSLILTFSLYIIYSAKRARKVKKIDEMANKLKETAIEGFHIGAGLIVLLIAGEMFKDVLGKMATIIEIIGFGGIGIMLASISLFIISLLLAIFLASRIMIGKR